MTLSKRNCGQPFVWRRRRGFTPVVGLSSYGDAYRAAAQATRAAIQRNEACVQAHPVAFLYRHSLEAYLKAILLDFGTPLGISAQRVRSGNHRLSRQVPDVIKVSQTRLGTDLSPRTVELIRRFTDGDPSATLFRYPDDADFRNVFDLDHFCCEVESAIEELQDIHSRLREDAYRQVYNDVIGPLDRQEFGDTTEVC